MYENAASSIPTDIPSSLKKPNFFYTDCDDN